MQTYWAAVVRIPKAIVKEINSLLKSFLWNHGKCGKGKAKVAWSVVCCSKEEGGLGLKNLDQWNEVLLIKHIWKLVTNADSLWVKWVNRVKLKDKSFWEMNVTKQDCGTWKALLELRAKVRPFIWHTIGNGKKTLMWYDYWHTAGPLSNFISNKSIYDARISCNASIADMIEENSWCWPNEWYHKFPILNQIQVPNLVAANSDTVKWRSKAGQLINFSTQNAWKDLKEEFPAVKWYKVVWFNSCNPRWAFTLWMAVKRKLLTQDRMMKWCPDVLLGPLCKSINDSHNHLFFQCEYSMEVWKQLKKDIKMSKVPEIWDQIVLMMENMACTNSIWSVVNRLIIAATVYYIWKERNDRIFVQDAKSTEVLVLNIKEQLRLKLMSLKVRKTVHTEKVAELWNVKFQH